MRKVLRKPSLRMTNVPYRSFGSGPVTKVITSPGWASGLFWERQLSPADPTGYPTGNPREQSGHRRGSWSLASTPSSLWLGWVGDKCAQQGALLPFSKEARSPLGWCPQHDPAVLEEDRDVHCQPLCLHFKVAVYPST